MILLVIVGVILAIVLPLTLKSSDDAHVNAFLTQEYVAFSLDPKSIVDSKYEVTLTLN